MQQQTPFEELAAQLPGWLALWLKKMPLSWQSRAEEIRLRAGRPLAVCLGGEQRFLTQDGTPILLPAEGLCPAISPHQLEDVVLKLCEYSLHTYQEQLAEGYLPLPGGHRAGVCGTAALEGGRITALRQVEGLNLRIARRVPGAADGLLRRAFCTADPPGLLLAGAPGSGKTTLLRELALALAGGWQGRCLRVAVIDERMELGGGGRFIHQGYGADFYSGYPKAQAMMQALRAMAPQVMVCDEIGTPQELQAVTDCLNAGVCCVCSVHAGSPGQLLRRRQGQALLQTRAFGLVAFLQSGSMPGQVERWVQADDLLDEGRRLPVGGGQRGDGGDLGGPPREKPYRPAAAAGVFD